MWVGGRWECEYVCECVNGRGSVRAEAEDAGRPSAAAAGSIEVACGGADVWAAGGV